MERLAFSCGLPLGAGDDTRRPVAVASRVEESDARLARLDRVAYRALLAFTIVLFTRPQDTLPFLEPLHLADLTAIFALTALVAGRLARGAPVSRLTPELGLVLALGAVMLATAPFSVWPGGAVAVFTDLFSKVILVFALIINLVTTRVRLERLVTVVVLGTSYIAVLTVVDYATGVNMAGSGLNWRVEGERAGGAVSGLFGNPNDLALNMVAFLPLAILMAIRRGRPILRALALVGVPAMVAAIIVSKSRGGTVGLVAMLLVLLYQMRRVRPGVAVLVLAAGLATIPMLPSSFTDRMSSIFNPEEDPTGSREARKRLLRDGFRAFRDNPIVGLGAGQFMNYKPEGREEPWRETHNALLQVASELGIAGLVIFVAVVVSGFAAALRVGAALRRARRRHRRARGPDEARGRRELLELYAAALVASLTGWLAAAMFASVAYYWTFYLVLGLAVTFRDITRLEIREISQIAREPRRAAAA